MNNKDKAPDNIDRILRILYSDSDLCDLLIWDLGHDWDNVSIARKIRRTVSNRFFFTLPCRTNASGAEEDEQWLFMTERYMQMYPHDYNDNEVAVVFNSVFEEAKDLFPFQEFNSALLFPYCAKSMLEQKNGELFVKRGLLFEWEGLNNKIDSNVVFSAYNAFVSGRRETHLSAKQADSRLRKILAKGFSENHAHLKGSGYSPEISWFAFQYLFFNQKEKCLKCLRSIVQARWRELERVKQEKTVFAFEKIPIVRALLAAYRPGFFQGTYDDRPEPTSAQLDGMLERLFLVQDEVSLEMLMDCDDFGRVLDTYYSRYVPRDIPQSAQEIISFEQDYLYDSFLMLKNGALSKTAIYALNVYIAAISQFKFCVVQDNQNIGFKRFSRFERKKDIFIDCIKDGLAILYESAFDKYYQNGGVKFVEFRIAPKIEAKEHLRKTVDLLDKANERAFTRWSENNPDLERIRYGLIIHYIKDEELPVTDMWVGRKEKLQDRVWKQFLGLWNLYESSAVHSSYMNKVVGIDAANFEISTRPEVFGPLFTAFRDKITPKSNTGITYHAGEDFVTLVNGLRAIDETLTFIGLDEGDRIGHATALGLDVNEYFKAKRECITTSLQEHVDDFAWMHRLINESEMRDADILQYLEKQYFEYAMRLFKNTGIAVPCLAVYQASMEMRGENPEELFAKRQSDIKDDIQFPCEDNFRRPDFYYFVYQYDEQSKKNGLRSLVLQVSPDYIDAAKLAQKIMIHKVHDREITIEANPTSNRKISFVRHFSDLQIFKLNSRGINLPEDMHCGHTPDIPISINTDNCGVFQTDLAMEYALVVEALSRKDVRTEEIYPYIDYLRELSLVQSFVNGKNTYGCCGCQDAQHNC